MSPASPGGRISVAIIFFATAGWMGGCSDDDVADLTGPTETESALIISDTALGTSAGSGVSAAGQSPPAPASTTSAAEANANVAYISLPAGTVPRGVTATISNQRTGSIVSVLLVDGGFDPVAVVARAGDVLQIKVQSADGATLVSYVRTVPGKRPPKVVRTNPPPGKRDVALNTTISIVFSEPIDARTLTETSIRLLRNGVPVDGRLGFHDASHLVVAFAPAALAGATEYQLVVTQSVRDLDGEALEMPVTVAFRTVEPTQSAGLSRIAFSDWRSISVISADGSNFTRLVDDAGQGWQYMSPAWSPDGSKIAFGSSRDGGWDIYVMNADGSAVTRLTSEVTREDEPAWSPDGSRIAFTSNRDGDFEIHVMNADGTGVIKLTDHPAQDGNPAWSPDGSRIAFTSDRDGNNELYVMNADGTNTVRLTNVSDEAIHPEWSPDGRKILFTRTVAGQYVMNADGSELRSLNVHGGGATWSPNGTQIVFSNGNLFVINPDGSGLRNLNVQGYEPAWGPAGPIVSNPVPRAGRILVDASRDGGVWWYPQWAQEGGFNPTLDHQGKRLADYLRVRGYEVVELPRPFTITRELFASYDIVIRASGFGTYTRDEIEAYQSYVNAGGQLLLLGDHMMNLPADELALSFGLEFAGITRGENILTIAAAHPVTWGMANIAYGVGSGLLSYPTSAQILGRLSGGSYLDLNKDDRQDDGEPSAPAVLGAMTHGAGRIVFCGDANLWNWVPQPLVDNVLEWFGTS
jgi:Tol biopolymer transport system component